MKSSFLLFFLALITASCKNEPTTERPTYSEFVFSCSEENANYSIKFISGDTIFLEKRFPRPRELYYAIIQHKEKEKLDSFLNKTDFTQYDTVYFQNNLQDGVSYKFYLTKDTATNWVLIYGNEGPKPLYDFAKWLTNLKDRQTFYSIDTTIDFGNLKYILLPPIPPPPINNSH
jgi:hypothetical protein